MADTKMFSCTGCGYVHKGDAPPDCCPVCKAPAAGFIELGAAD